MNILQAGADLFRKTLRVNVAINTYFWRFSPIFGKKLAIFFKINVMIHFSHKLHSCVLSQQCQ
jgi:hypothetical protein